MIKPFLFTPGPTPLPPSVLKALSEPIPYHRGAEFKSLFLELQPKLRELFSTKNDVLILTSSGTGAMEAAMSNLLSPGEKVLAIQAGKFGERFVKLSKAFQLDIESLDVPWGKNIDLQNLEAQVTKEHKALLFQISETSTGSLLPFAEIAKIARRKNPEILLIADAITAIGAMPVSTDELELDVVISGSQKALMLPPGLAFLSLSQRAIFKMDSSKSPRFYFDLKRELSEQQKGQTAFTPSISLILALRESLRLLFEEGLTKVFKRHERLAKASRLSLQTLGLELASQSPSVACTAVFLPSRIDGKTFLKSIRERYGFTIAGGQDQWEGKALRLSHLGYYSAFDLLSAIAAIGRELERQGVLAPTGQALEVFMKTYDL